MAIFTEIENIIDKRSITSVGDHFDELEALTSKSFFTGKIKQHKNIQIRWKYQKQKTLEASASNNKVVLGKMVTGVLANLAPDQNMAD